MIVCAQCGESNAPGSEFCGACGTYLEWERAQARQPLPGPGGRSQAGPGQTGHGQAGQAPPDNQPVSWPLPTRGGSQPGPPYQPGPPPNVGSRPHQAGPPGQGGAGHPPVGQPGPLQPGAMRPTDQQPAAGAHRPRLTERRAPQPGDLICGQCGEANPPTRKFCARCGSALVEPEVVAEKWWRRLLPKRKPPEAGTRRHRRTGAARRGIGKALRWSFLIALLAAIGVYGLVPSFRSLVNTQAVSVAEDVKGVFVTELTPVRPTGVSANAESPDHPPLMAADNAKNTFWLAPVEPQQPALLLDFGREVDLREAIVRVGNPDDLQAAHRPKKLHLVYSTGKTFDVDIADTPDEQKVGIENSAGATNVEVHVVELHRSLRGNEVALAEIEFFAVR
ncbi:zinc ribbon domain-containing protein [Saccharothrix deserti]|uniref:zinc ribbon domain-containing protein n=1 Tax=Saccharothrix deserti TaxID=2593674 RepID=UPI00131C7749|nr:zinc ribbon domain-containing protein [Saccharothrix deserti]